MDLETVSFALAPRLNAAGRVGEAMEAARLLLAEDATEAAAHADALELANGERRDLMKAAVTEARALVADAPDAPATLVRGPWGVGIVGLVAARLAEDRGRAAVVGADLGDVIRASCRSDGAMDLGCRPWSSAATSSSGSAATPAPPASRSRPTAGTTSRPGSWPWPRSAAPVDPRVTLPIDLALPARDVDYALFREFNDLTPAGPGNPDPLVAVLGLTVTRVRAATGGHTQLTLRRERDVLDGIAFGRADLAETVHEGDRVDVVARLASRVFGGFESLQLEVRDVCLSGYHDAHPDRRATRSSRADPPLAEVPA